MCAHSPPGWCSGGAFTVCLDWHDALALEGRQSFGGGMRDKGSGRRASWLQPAAHLRKKSLKIPSVANCRARFSRLLISIWWICRLLCLCVWARACVEKGMRTEWSLISNRGGLRIPQKGNLISSLSQAGQIDSKLVSHDSLLKKSLVYTADYWCIKQWDG